ncbi:unnamed protein product [Somion occarium]|uniref:Uncharacterized protein n=1 Tax=Somion occarium TaxID=3059160 RepID=A0ABP1CRL4_9APHY
MDHPSKDNHNSWELNRHTPLHPPPSHSLPIPSIPTAPTTVRQYPRHLSPNNYNNSPNAMPAVVRASSLARCSRRRGLRRHPAPEPNRLLLFPCMSNKSRQHDRSRDRPCCWLQVS